MEARAGGGGGGGGTVFVSGGGDTRSGGGGGGLVAFVEVTFVLLETSCATSVGQHKSNTTKTVVRNAIDRRLRGR